ncbi:MAG: hypothetical protein KME57_26350 [Scytonema hyalinum WJT4-NPBG1]|nr:hypothetical protein [Scytonema hyalinum WJT4-NPBG1]
MTQDKDRTGETRVTSEGNFVTDDYGRERQATPEEIEAQIQQWEEESRNEKGKRK